MKNQNFWWKNFAKSFGKSDNISLKPRKIRQNNLFWKTKKYITYHIRFGKNQKLWKNHGGIQHSTHWQDN